MTTMISRTAAPPEWWDRALKDACTWLTTRRFKRSTRNVYACDLGVPRDWWYWAGAGIGDRRRPVADLPYFEWCRAKRIDPFTVSDAATMEAWRDAMCKAGVSRPTQARRLTVVRGWYIAAVGRGDRVSVPPKVRAGEPVADTQLTLDVLRALRLAAARSRSEHKRRDALIVDLLAITGLSCREVVALNLGDVRIDANGQYRLVVRSDDRQMILPVDLGRRLTRFIVSRRQNRGTALEDDMDQWPLCVGEQGQRLGEGSLRDVLDRLMCVLKVNAKDPAERTAAALLTRWSLSLRQFRALARSTARAGGVPERVVRAWLGQRPAVGDQADVGDGEVDVPPSVVVANAIAGDAGVHYQAA